MVISLLTLSLFVLAFLKELEITCVYFAVCLSASSISLLLFQEF